MALFVAGGVAAAAIAVAGGYGFYRMMRGGQWSPAEQGEHEKQEVESTHTRPQDDSDSATQEPVDEDNQSERPNTVENVGQGEATSEACSHPSDHAGNIPKPQTESTLTTHHKQQLPPPVVAPKPTPSKKRNTVLQDTPPVSPKPFTTPDTLLQSNRKAMAPISPNAIPVLPVAFRAGTKLRQTDDLQHNTENTSVEVPGGEEVPVSFEEPVKAPTLRSPSRNKGPSNRRLPTRH